MQSPSFENDDYLRWLHGRTANRRCAVTIVELIIVIMVMSIMAAVAAPAFFETLLHHRVESAARRVKADLELARQTARLTSATQSLTFTGSSYAMSAAAEGLDNPSAVYAVDLAAAPFELEAAIANFNGAKTVSFDGYGMPSSSGTVELSSKGHRSTVALDGTTGEVTITSLHTRGGAVVADVN